jgi:nucleotide-binding universal stress UspA family protein
MDVVVPASPRYPLAPTPGQSQSALTLVPLDGTPQAERVIPFAAAHARASGDRLILVGIASRPADTTVPSAGVGLMIPGPTHPAPTMARYLRWIAETLAERDLVVRVSVCAGTGARAIADAARLWAADLVIMAAHDFGGPTGDVTALVRAVMRRAAVPVLVVPTPGTPTAREDRLVAAHGWRHAGAARGGRSAG